jgi:hypothetical protein
MARPFPFHLRGLECLRDGARERFSRGEIDRIGRDPLRNKTGSLRNHPDVSPAEQAVPPSLAGRNGHPEQADARGEVSDKMQLGDDGRDIT